MMLGLFRRLTQPPPATRSAAAGDGSRPPHTTNKQHPKNPKNGGGTRPASTAPLPVPAARTAPPGAQAIRPGTLVPTRGTAPPVAFYGRQGAPIPFPNEALLTAPGALLAQDDAVRELLALYRSGIFLVRNDRAGSPLVLTFVRTARSNGIQISINDAHLVEAAVLQAAYQRHQAAISATPASAAMQAEMQRRFRDIMKLAAEQGITDVWFRATQNVATVNALRGKTIVHGFVDLSPTDCYALQGAAFSMADPGGSDTQYNPRRHQSVRISNHDGLLHPDIATLRLEYSPLNNDGRLLNVRLLTHSAGHADGDASLTTLGYTDAQQRQIALMIARTYGVNLVIGPTGSGKSTTLHKCLTTLNRVRQGQSSIFTLEDPVELPLDGAYQIPIFNTKDEEDKTKHFQTALSSILRSKPNIIMVQEIRTAGLAGIVFQAAMTGHQVWTTLHGNGALSAIDRLRDIGVDDYKVYDADIVTGLVCQRLVARLCPECRTPITKADLRSEMDQWFLARLKAAMPADWDQCYVKAPHGCSKCEGGHRGLALVAEVVVPDATLMRHLQERNIEGAIPHWTENLGGRTMRQHAIDKIREGLVDPRDVEAEIGPLAMVYG